jgi:hypothetical protein
MGPLGTSATEWPIVPAPGDYDDGDFGGIKTGSGNRSTRRKPAAAPLCPPQIPLDQTRVESQRLTAFAMARPSTSLNNLLVCIHDFVPRCQCFRRIFHILPRVPKFRSLT